LIAGQWRPAQATGTFRADNPAAGEALPDEYPVSGWGDVDAALDAATEAMGALRSTPPDRLAQFLTRFAERLEARAEEIVAMAHVETGLPRAPRLAEVELPRTTNQLRLAAQAAVEGSWALPTIDTKVNIRSYYAALGPVWVFGPNNFPFAFNSAAGGDFAAAIAAGNPVIAKANTSHPGTTRLLAEEAAAAAKDAAVPPAILQLLYRTGHPEGERLVADPRTGAVAYTGSRSAGLKLKTAADAVGKPIYLELSSVNPVVILPGALAERGDKIAEEFAGSSLLGTGQFCTNPGLVVLIAGEATERFVGSVKQRFEAAAITPLLSSSVARSLEASMKVLREAGAAVVTGGVPASGPGYRFANSLLRVDGRRFVAEPEKLQTEAFGNATVMVVARDADEAGAVLDSLEGNLTGSFYTDTKGADDAIHDALVPRLRPRVGRLLNDKMPTGVAVSSAMHHGGPFPSTGHPGFTAVGIPASLRRFGMLQCFDAVRPSRLPPALRDQNPNGTMWRLIDGSWSRANIGA
jgi:NADP-dependent aldehyde dehydrogenase